MTKRDFLSLKSTFLQGVVLSVLMAGNFLVPAVTAAISETPPSSFPAEILADWKDQGGTAACRLAP